MSVYSDITARLSESGNLRTIPCPAIGSHNVIDLSSNDYLGLGTDPSLQAEFMDSPARRAIPLTSSASRLLAGRQDEYASLEALLQELYCRPALLFNSGYHANTGLVSALAGVKGTMIVADRLVHASIIDGMVLSKAPFTRFRHNDLGHLERIIEKESRSHERLLVIVESVYSMDGDHADIEALTAIKRRHPGVMLYVDEAHAFGVEGARGLGLCRSAASYTDVDVVVCTFGKACASMGAFAAVSPDIREYLVNTSRSFIFSTALPPISAAWTEWVIRHFVGLDSRRDHLRSLGSRLHSILAPLSASPTEPSHIQPLVVGDPRKAVELSQSLLEAGFKVLPIRTPTVPPGTERLRFSLSASLPLEALDPLDDFFSRNEI